MDVPKPDAGTPDAPSPDPQDAATDSAPPFDPPLADDALILNGSFETTSLDVLGTVTVDNWERCQGDVALGSEFDNREASDGSSLVSMAFGIGFPVLSQRLGAPLKAGVLYTLAVDLGRSDEGPDELSLEVYGGSTSCAETTSLARSEPLTDDEDLRTYCLTFTPERDFPYLVLAVDPLTITGALYLDHVRFDASCDD